MANENEVDILMSVDLDASETLKTIAALRSETADLRQQQKELDRTTAEGAVEYERLNTQIKANTKTIQQHEKEVVNSIKQDNAKEGSIKSMRAELSNAKAAYAELSKAEREGAKGRELLTKTADLNAELKELESAYGDNYRKVGEYELAGQSLAAELGDITKNLHDLAAAGLQNSDTYREMIDRAVELKNAQDEVNQSIANGAKGTATFDAMVQGAQAVTAAYGVWQSAAAALGIENEELEATMKKFMVVMQALQSLQALSNVAQKQSNIYRAASNILQKIGIKQTTQETVATTANVAAIRAESIAENASNAAKTKGVVATKLATAQQWLWNAAMSANPVLLLVVAVMALIAGITALVGWLSKESAAAKDAASAQKAYNDQLEKSSIEQERLTVKTNAAINRRQLAARREIAELKANNTDKMKIAAAEAKAATDVRNIEIEAANARRKAAETSLAAARKLAAAQVKARDELKVGSTKWSEYNNAIKETNASIREYVSIVNDEFFAAQNFAQDQIEADAKAKADRKADAKERVDTAISTYSKLIDEQKKFNEEALKAEAEFQSTDIRIRQDYARQMFALNQKAERDKLDNLRKYNKITEAEYTRSLAVMTAQLQEFSNGQVVELNKYFDDERKAIIGMLTQTLDEEIADVEKKYADAVKRLEEIEMPTMLSNEDPAVYAARLAEYETFALEQARTVIRLEEERDRELERLRDSYTAKQIKDIEEASIKAYASDLAKYQTNERMKLDVTEKMLQDQIAAKKAAGLEVYAEEAQLDQIALQRTAMNLEQELALASNSAKKRYDAKVKALEAESTIYADNADKQFEIAQELADAERELLEARIESFGQWRDAASEVFNGLNELFNAGLERQSQKIKESYDNDVLALSEARAAGRITEAKYNHDVLALEQKREKEEAKLERKKAIRERAGKVFSVVTDTAVSIAASSKMGFPAAIPFIALAAATGALSLATILSEPLPKAARGGLINGPSHAQGGAIIEAEGGEAIITKRAVSMFGPVLSALNELGGGVPFAGPLSDGGYTLRAASSNRSVTADELASAMKELKIYTIVEDVNRGQDQYARMQANGTIL